MERRLIMAIALSVLIIVIFQHFVVKPPEKQRLPAATETAAAPVPAKEAEMTTPQPKPSFEEKDFAVETGRYIITFSNVGGSIKGIRLKGYKDPASKEPLELVSLKNPREYILAMQAVALPGSLDLSDYKVERNNGGVTCSLRAENFEIVKRYILHNSKYGIELQLSARNISSSPKEFGYRIIGAAGLNERSAHDKGFVEVTSKVDGRTIKFKRPRNGERITTPGVVSWTALKNKYFSIILKPFNSKDAFYYQAGDGSLVTGIDSNPVAIQPGAFVEERFILYAGPSHIPALKEFGYEFDETVNYGFFGGISKAMLSLMRFFYSIVRSWGISIILLSVFLNIILFPLTIKSFKSMQKMQELHPEMEKLKAKHKGDAQKLNKEIMELYKKYKINPLSGCLPMLLQMPVFIALYQALMKSIELKGASFLWIKDLSAPDAVPIPISLPIVGDSINILPLIMVAAMVFQQKISAKSMGGAVSEEQKQQQKMMLIMMPIMFGFIFYNMPSGLVLYWVVNTLLTIGEQAYITKSA